MNLANLFAIELITIGIFLSVILYCQGQNPKRFKPYVKAFLLFIVFSLIALVLTSNICYSGSPVNVILLFSGLMALWYRFIADAKKRAVGIVVLFALMYLGTLQFSSLSKTPGLTGNPDLQKMRLSFRESVLVGTKNELYESFGDLKIAIEKSGRISNIVSNTPIIKLVSRLENPILYDVKTIPFWHSTITGIYQVQSIPLRAWIGHGEWPAVIETIELRPLNPKGL